MIRKLVDIVNWMRIWTYTNIKGQDHSLTLVQGHSDSTFSNFFSLEIARPIEARFHVGPAWDWKLKVCSNGPCHVTNMAAMLIYGKNLEKSSLEPNGWWPWKLVCSIWLLSTTKFVQMMTLGWPWPILWQGPIWSCVLLYKKKVKQSIFQKLVVWYQSW